MRLSTLKMTSPQVVQAPIKVTPNSPSQDCTHQDDRTSLNNIMVSYHQRQHVTMANFSKTSQVHFLILIII